MKRQGARHSIVAQSQIIGSARCVGKPSPIACTAKTNKYNIQTSQLILQQASYISLEQRARNRGIGVQIRGKKTMLHGLLCSALRAHTCEL